MEFSTVHNGVSSRSTVIHVGILIFVKGCSSFAIFLFANFINTKLSHTIPWIANSRFIPSGALHVFGPVFQIVTFIQFGSGLIFMILLNVLKLNTLPPPRDNCSSRDSYWIRVVKHAGCSIALLWLRIGGLQLCGPFRTVFVGTYYDVTLAGIVGVLMLRQRSRWQLQGVLLFGVGYMLEFLYDDSHLDHLHEPWHLFTNSIGLFLLLISAFLKFVFNGTEFTRNLVKASGGPIQLHTASTFVSGIICLVVSLIELISSGDMIFFHVLPLSFIVIFGFVLDYYADAIMMRKLDAVTVASIGTTASFFSAFIFALVLSRVGNASTPGLMSLLAFGSIYIGTICLNRQTSADKASFYSYPSTGDDLPRFSLDKSVSVSQKENSGSSHSHPVVLIA